MKLIHKRLSFEFTSDMWHFLIYLVEKEGKIYKMKKYVEGLFFCIFCGHSNWFCFIILFHTTSVFIVRTIVLSWKHVNVKVNESVFWFSLFFSQWNLDFHFFHNKADIFKTGDICQIIFYRNGCHFGRRLETFKYFWT